MHSDPIADLLTRLRNAVHAGKNTVELPYSTIKHNILKLMKENKFISNVKVEKKEKFSYLQVELDEGRKEIHLRRISKPGQRIYIKNKDIKKVKSGLGFNIISTPQGLISSKEARQKNVGGEVICEIY